MATTITDPIDIRAADELVGLSIAASGTVDIQAGVQAEDGTPKRPTFKILGYTGAVMQVAGFYTPVIVDLAGLKAASQTIPALRDHDSGRIVGQTSEVKIDAEGVRLAGTITGENAEAVEVVTQSKNGFRWQASIGASVDRREFLESGKSAVVNGRNVTGPLVIARNSTLKEISFVAIGADGQTTATLAASSSPQGLHSQEHPMNFDEWLKAKGFDPAGLSDTQKVPLKAAFDAEQRAASAATEQEHGGGNSPESNHGQTSANVSAAVGATGAGTRSLDEIVATERKELERVNEINKIIEAAAKDRPLMLDTLHRMGRAAIEGKSSPLELKLKVFEVAMATPGAPAVHARGSLVEEKNVDQIVEAAICRAGGLDGMESHFKPEVLEAADHRFKGGLGLIDVLMLSAREHGQAGCTRHDPEGLLRAAFAPQLRASGFSTLSLPGIFSNTANKFLRSGFGAVEDSWRAIASRRNVRDLKAISAYTLTGGMKFEKVGPTGEIKHGTLGEVPYANKADTYGRMFAITREHIINDDLGALTEVPSMIGRGAAESLNEVFWTVFLAGVAANFWSSGNANVSTGADSALGATGLAAAHGVFRKQTQPNGNPLGIPPRILLVPPELEILADELMTSTQMNSGGAATAAQIPNANVWRSKYRVVSSTYLSNTNFTGNSAAAWYLLADPAQLPTIEVAFLNGRELPIVESAAVDFNTLGVQMRGYFDFGVARQEYRASVRSAGS